MAPTRNKPLLSPLIDASITPLLSIVLVTLAGWQASVARQTGSPSIHSDLSVTPDAATPMRVDLNQADERDLANLPGIGPKLARRILDQVRQKNGLGDWSDFEPVTGLGPSKWSVIRQWCRLKS